MGWRSARLGAVCVLAIGVFGASTPLGAQASGRGYLFKDPRVRLTVRGGFDGATAGGDLFSFVTEQLTLEKRDFRGGTFGMDAAVRFTPRIDAVLAASFAKATEQSEVRDYVDTENNEIEQTTTLTRSPFTLGLRAYLTPRGRSVGSLAWIPTRFSPYVGVGGGAMHYEFQQAGDFVDYETLDIFYEDLVSSGWTPTAHAALGFDYSLSAPIALNVEAKYSYARASLGEDFVGFDRIDLSGVSTMLGLSLRF